MTPWPQFCTSYFQTLPTSSSPTVALERPTISLSRSCVSNPAPSLSSALIFIIRPKLAHAHGHRDNVLYNPPSSVSNANRIVGKPGNSNWRRIYDRISCGISIFGRLHASTSRLSALQLHGDMTGVSNCDSCC